ncbi:MAG: MATE family efflux transporter, partial [Pseudomonadota bacterium]
ALGFSMGLLLGVQVLTSELVGREEEDQSGRIFRRGVLWALPLGAVMMVLLYFGAGPLFHLLFVTINPNNSISDLMTPVEFADETAAIARILSFSLLAFTLSTVCSYYLEALRRPLLVTFTSYFGVAVNLMIDLAFVLGWWGFPQLGATGVAWATVTSRWMITIALIGFVLWLTPALAPAKDGPEDEARRQLTVGGGTAASNVAEWGGFNLTYTIAAFISIAANAVYGYAVQVMGICFMFFLGIGTATSVRVAEQIGRGNRQGVQDASRLGVAATFLVGAFLALFIYIFRDQVALWMVSDVAEIDGQRLAPAIAALMIYAAFAVTFDGLQATASMALRAQGVVWVPTAIHIASFFALMIPAGFFLGISYGRGAQGMMEAACLALLVAGIAQWVVLEMKMARPQRETRHPVPQGE